MKKNDLKKILISLDIYDETFWEFIKTRVKSLPLNVSEFGWGCFIITNDNQILTDIKVLVPDIIDESTLLVNIHELAHAYELYGNLGLKYEENIEASEKYAKEKELLYLKIGTKNFKI